MDTYCYPVLHKYLLPCVTTVNISPCNNPHSYLFSDDYRMFAGDLGNDVTDELLTRTFNGYPSFVKARVVRDKFTNKSKGYGFLSFKDPDDYTRAMKEMNGRYVGSRPIKLRKSQWRDRNLDVIQKKVAEKQLLGLK
ncbi:RNA-binding protein 42 [Hyalella azteca]|nr:RNA-binding protein 42 [Hyalella azteca]